MTRLLRWLLFVAIFGIIWLMAVSGSLATPSTIHHFVLLFLPLIVAIAFGAYALGLLIFKVATFNDCPEAAAELRKEIEQARKDLVQRGFKFVDDGGR